LPEATEGALCDVGLNTTTCSGYREEWQQLFSVLGLSLQFLDAILEGEDHHGMDENDEEKGAGD
jgi:hypothetical protein